VEVQVREADARLLPDMSVRVNFLAEAKPVAPGTAVVLAPRAGLRRDDRGAYVWLVDGEHVRRRAVTVGTELGDRVQVADGLGGGETLVIGDATALADGAAVKVATPDLANEKPIP
jgi:multidrug efflux pump subunit AcrA (membrane-fusion protein)